MNADTLNRIGIILNFLAGFLLAPELLGINRIRRFERSLENKIVALKSFSSRFLQSDLGQVKGTLRAYMSFEFFGSSWKEKAKGILFYSPIIVGGIALISGYFFVGLIIFVGYLAYFVIWGLFDLFLALIGIRKSEAADSIKNQFNALLSLWIKENARIKLVMIFAFIVMLVVIPVIYLAYVPLMVTFMLTLTVLRDLLTILNRITNWLLRKLDGEDSIRGLLVAIGIVFFIFGNMLQFLATF